MIYRVRTTKTCVKCGHDVSLRNYRRSRKQPDGYSDICNDCRDRARQDGDGHVIGDLRRVVAERDGGCCRICRFSAVVDIHHIVARKDGGINHPDNLITLCPNHHAMVHRAMISPDELRAALGLTGSYLQNGIRVDESVVEKYREKYRHLIEDR